MPGVLVVAEVTDGQVEELTRELVTAGVSVANGPLTLGVAAPSFDERATALDGVDAVLAVGLPEGPFDHEAKRHAVETMIERVRPDVVIMGFTLRNAAFAAGLAAARNMAFAADVVGVERDAAGVLLAVKPVYGGKVNAEFEIADGATAMLLLRPEIWSAAQNGAARGIEVLALEPPESRVHHVEFVKDETVGVDLTRSDVIVSVGRGVGEKDIGLFAELAKKLGVGLGASRPMVDAGWLPHAHQVGQSGNAVKPNLYIAFGISGALQHVVGIRGAKKVIAVNTDREAPIFNVADQGAVADAVEVAEEMWKRVS